MSVVTCYMFYKNVLLVLPQWYYSFYSGFAGQNIYFDGFYQVGPGRFCGRFCG